MPQKLVEKSLRLLERGQVEKAFELASRSVDETPGDPLAWFVFGQAAYFLGKNEFVLEAADTVLELTEGMPGAEDVQGAMLLAAAEVCWQEWRFELAESYLEEALELNPDEAVCWDLKGVLLEFQGRTQEAQFAYRKAARLDPVHFSPPAAISERDAYAFMDEVLSALPPELEPAKQDLQVKVEDFPTWEIIEKENDGELMSTETLIFFAGVPLPEQTEGAPKERPKLFLFRRNLERARRDLDEVREYLRGIVQTELAYYLGMSKSEMRRLGIEP
ncbi:MAG: hypothetical protein Kow00109_24560 [Acidobacteriota bacterium]